MFCQWPYRHKITNKIHKTLTVRSLICDVINTQAHKTTFACVCESLYQCEAKKNNSSRAQQHIHRHCADSIQWCQWSSRVASEACIFFAENEEIEIRKTCHQFVKNQKKMNTQMLHQFLIHNKTQD